MPEYRFVMRQGPTPGQVIELAKSNLTIGRDISNDIIIVDPEVSRTHVRLLLEAGRYRIEDLGSTNGTFINGQRLMGPHVLTLGEQVNLGDNVQLIYESVLLDPAATMAGRSVNEVMLPGSAPAHPPDSPPAIAPPPVPAYPQPKPTGYAPESKAPVAVQPSPQRYSGQVPPGPVVEPSVPPPAARAKKPVNLWLLAGGGCLMLVILVFIAVWVFIDQPWSAGAGYYCTPPLDLLFQALGFVCP
jgi:pSer/pThr/pTyr-binding forkhead associated (FHA) protein